MTEGFINRYRSLHSQVTTYKLEEEREIRPITFAHLLSHTLYQKRFGSYFTEPIVAGLDPTKDYEPYICATDTIGCIDAAKDFVVAGTCSENMFGMCESLWEKDLVLPPYVFR